MIDVLMLELVFDACADAWPLLNWIGRDRDEPSAPLKLLLQPDTFAINLLYLQPCACTSLLVVVIARSRSIVPDGNTAST